jgi:hypothetical protein
LYGLEEETSRAMLKGFGRARRIDDNISGVMIKMKERGLKKNGCDVPVLL